MGYERYPRSNFGDHDRYAEDSDYPRTSADGRDDGYPGARRYQPAGAPDRNRDRDYGPREYGHGGYAQRDRSDTGDRFAGGRGDRDGRSRGYGGAPQGYDYQDRGFIDRAGDEVRSWFGDDEAERRRALDARYDNRGDADYHHWRSGQIAALDRDYDEYRSENRSKFSDDFASWRTEREGQRGSLSKVAEHMDVVGSDNAHVGTVDKVRGDRIILTKNDQDAGGRHHSIPSRWIQSIDDKVTLRKTADEAKAHWRDEERNRAFFHEEQGQDDQQRDRGAHNLNRSFSGTY